MKNYTLFLLFAILASCASQSKMELPDFKSGPDAIIYKTTQDYRNLVPVILSKDKATLLSYPHPTDLKTNGLLAVPAQLKKGYLLDNRGINEQVAFTSFTYEQYAAMHRAPDPDIIMQSLTDTDPLKEMYNCGLRSKYKTIGELNQLIKKGFEGAIKVK